MPMGEAMSRSVRRVLIKRLAANTRRLHLLSPLRAVPKHIHLLAVEYGWAKILTQMRKTWRASELAGIQAYPREDEQATVMRERG
jgi:hypothetical protein